MVGDGDARTYSRDIRGQDAVAVLQARHQSVVATVGANRECAVDVDAIDVDLDPASRIDIGGYLDLDQRVTA